MNILHITDLHFSYDDFQSKESLKKLKKKWKKLIKLAVKENEKTTIDFIAVTGDITNHGAPVEFEKAQEYIKGLMKAVGLTRDRVLFCPGNHDMDGDEPHSDCVHYQEFLCKFYKRKTPMTEAWNKKEWKLTGKRLHIKFISLNTCTETSLTFFDWAVICKDELKDFEDIKERDYGIVLMHHQPEVIKNQSVFEELASSGKARLILSGHFHSMEPRVYEVGKSMVINGMAISPHLKWLASGFQMVHIKPGGEVKVKAIVMEEGDLL